MDMYAFLKSVKPNSGLPNCFNAPCEPNGVTAKVTPFGIFGRPAHIHKAPEILFKNEN